MSFDCLLHSRGNSFCDFEISTWCLATLNSTEPQVIDRRVRELFVESEILPLNTPAQEIAQRYKAVIISGGPQSVFGDEAPKYDPELFKLGASPCHHHCPSISRLLACDTSFRCQMCLTFEYVQSYPVCSCFLGH